MDGDGTDSSGDGGGKVRARFDGFTPPKRRRFIAALRKTGCISDAARVAGISRNTANRWRGKDAQFARLCAAAIDEASSPLAAIASERGVIGTEEPIYYHGKVIGTRVKRSDAIFRMLLMGSNPAKYGRMGAVNRRQIEREVRAKIEQEQGGADGTGRKPLTTDELRAIILQRLEEAHLRLRGTPLPDED